MPQLATTDDPRSILEESEGADEEIERRRQIAELASAVPRVLAWCLEGRTLAAIGMRVHVAALKLQVDRLNGMTQDQLGKQAGWGRSAVGNLAREFTETFGVRGLHDRDDSTRDANRKAWYRSRGIEAPRD